MSYHVLVIDDDSGITKALSIRLGANGFRVSCSSKGISGLEAAKQDPPDIIVLDIRMPDIDGFEVHSCLKANPALSHIPVVLLSANLQETARTRAAEAGVTRLISKPYDAGALIDVLKQELRLRLAA